MSAGLREKLDLFCCWCSKKDVDPNLVPAVIYRATKLTTKSHHMKNLTAKWIEMATKLNHEAFYASWAVAMLQARNFTTTINVMTLFDIRTVNSSSPNPIFEYRRYRCKQRALKKVIFYLKDSKISNPGHLYLVMELEIMYPNYLNLTTFIIIIITAQKMKFFIRDFFNKCDQICRKLRIWSHLLKKSLM